jgi:hypothetical protein
MGVNFVWEITDHIAAPVRHAIYVMEVDTLSICSRSIFDDIFEQVPRHCHLNACGISSNFMEFRIKAILLYFLSMSYECWNLHCR